MHETLFKMQKFDPYHRWLGIPPHEQPPTLYRLLGISDFESDQDVIKEATYRQIGHIKQYSSGPHRDAANRILNELSQAQVTLLDLKKKTQYDISIQSTDDEVGDASANDEVNVGLDVPVVVGEGSVRGGSFKEGVGGKRPIRRRRKKRSSIPTILFLIGLLVFVGVTFGYWWNQQNNVQPEGTIAKNTDASDQVDADDPDESPKNVSVKPTENKSAGAKGTDTAVSPRVTVGEDSQPDKVPSTNSSGDPANELVPVIAAVAEPDDLTALSYIERDAQKKLNQSGVKTYQQISQLTPDELIRLFKKSGAPMKGRLSKARQRCAKMIAEAKSLVEKSAAENLADTQGHTGPVTSVAFSKGGKWIASASDDMTLKLWDGMGERKCLRTFNGHESNVKSVAFSPGGNRIVTGSWDKTLILWSAVNGEKIRTFNGHSTPVWSVAFSPTGQQIVSGGEDGIKLWDAHSGRELLSFSGHSDTVTSVAFSPSGREIVSGSDDMTIKVWDSVSGSELRTLSGHTGKVTSVGFSPEGDQIISGSWDKTLILWEADSGKQLQTFSGHTKAVLSVAFSADGKRVASGSGDKSLLVWDVGTGQKLGAFEEHADYLTSIAFSPDGQRIVSGANDRTVRTWELAGLAPVVASVDDSKGPTFFGEKKTPDPDAGDSEMPDTSDPALPVNDNSLVTLKGHTGSVESVAVSRKGKWIVSASLDDTIILWDVKKREQKRAFDKLASTSRAVDFSPNEKWIINGTDTGDIELWVVSSGKKLQTLAGHKTAVFSVAFSPNGKQIASCDSSGDVMLWQAADRSVKKLTTGCKRVAFSRDGTLIATGGRAGKLAVWSAIDRKSLQTYKGSSAEMLSVAFSPDSRKIVSGCDDKTVKVWDVVSGAELKTFSGHTGAVKTVSFSPNGQWVASGSADGSIKLWDIDTGEELHTFSGHGGEVTSLAFLPDGKRLVSGGSDTTIKVWDLKEVGRK